MRKIWDSSKTRDTASLIFLAESRSRPIGFSTMTREKGPSLLGGCTKPALRSPSTASAIEVGGMAR